MSGGIKMKILILSGKFGMGHWSAANALRQSISMQMPSAQVCVVDLFQQMAPGCADAVYKAFSLLVSHGSGIYNTYYRCTEKATRPDGRHTLLHPLLDRLEELLREEKPDGILCTLPLCAQLVSCYKQERGLWTPMVTCITDLSVHPEWINRGTDCYLVGSRELRDKLALQGVPKQKILITGIPVRPEFYGPIHKIPQPRREVLLMGGGLGLLPKEPAFYEGLNALPNTHSTILTGSNQKLFDRLDQKYPNITVVPFTSQVRDYMLKADLMVSKPGGITLFEAISTALPLVMPKPFLQQEKNNADFAVRQGIGVVAGKSAADCLAAIEQLLDDPDARAHMSEQMLRLQGEWSARSQSAFVSAFTSSIRCA